MLKNFNFKNVKKKNFSKVKLVGYAFRKANLNKTNLTGANLIGITSSDIEGKPSLPEQWNLISGHLFGQKANLANTSFEEIDLSGLDLREVNFKGAILKGINFAGTNLSGSNFEGADLEGGNLTGSNLTDSSFEGANLEGANLTNAIIISGLGFGQRVNFNNVNLTNANLDDARIEYATFMQSNWNNVDFKKITLTHENIDMFGADLRGARFSRRVQADRYGHPWNAILRAYTLARKTF